MTETDSKHEDRPDIIEENTSSELRDLLGPLLCPFGIHNWGLPRAMNRVVLAGEKQDDGNWEHWTEDPSKTVTQKCRSCSRVRDREDLDRERLMEIQHGGAQ